MAILGPTRNHEEIRRWAEANRFCPAERLPARVDGEPAELTLASATQLKTHQERRSISWEDFFCRFDLHGLAFVYDDDSTGYNEILQVEQQSPYRHPEHKPRSIEN